LEKISNYIDGKFQEALSKQTIENIDPAVGEVYSQIPDSDERDVELAVQAAERAFSEWAALTTEKRSRLLLKIASLIEAHVEELAKLESIDSGKPIRFAKQIEIPRAAANFHFYGSAVEHFSSESQITDTRAINFNLRQPIGVVGCISPWNLPLYLFTWKVAPALAAGNCVVAKPSEITPMTAYRLAKICEEAGLPKGVLNIVHGYGHKAGQAITAHSKVKAISFTGSTRTGAEIAKTAAPLFKKVSLEMGGKNPNIIFADCDFDEMLQTTLRSSFLNQGQICLTGSRIFIEKPLYEKFKKEFVAEAAKWKVGDPLDEATLEGALSSKSHMEKVLSYIELAKKEGAKFLLGGNQVEGPGRCKNGYFMEPTILEALPPESRVCQEEIFGPVVSLIPFETEEEVLGYANQSPYGLAAMIWSRDIKRCHRMARQIESGIVWINCWLLRDLRTPFGGVKQSGLGREGGFGVLEFYTESKNVCIKVD